MIVLEKYLIEDINSVRQRFSNVPDDDFYDILKLDPTYTGGKVVGKYCKWLLTMYSNNDNPLKYGEEITNLLSKFHEYKTKPRKYKLSITDIGRIKTIEELKRIVDSVEELGLDDLSHRQKERELRNAYNEADHIFEDDMWDIYVPKTYASSCTLGKGTRWCTAYSDDDSYYKHYISKGNLYVFINKRNPSKKYQLHVETNSFTDADDNRCSLDRVLNTDEKLRDFVLFKIYKSVETFVYHGESKVPSNIVNLIVDDSVTSIDKEIFAKQKQLKTVKMPNVTSIGERAFYNCSNLITVEAPNVTSIGESVFQKCSNLTNINTSNVTSIGNFAFSGCKNLTNIDLSNVTSIGEYAFSSYSNLTTIDIPKVTSIGEGAFEYCSNLTTINAPNVISIGDYAFADCFELTYVDMPNVTSIGDYAFFYCINLTIIDISNVTSIGYGTFYNCEKLTTVIVSDDLDVSNIPEYVKVVRKGMNEHRRYRRSGRIYLTD